jgi:hypothetical protein
MPIYHATIRPVIIKSRRADDGSLWLQLRGNNNWYHEDDSRVYGSKYDRETKTHEMVVINEDGIPLIDFQWTSAISIGGV